MYVTSPRSASRRRGSTAVPLTLRIHFAPDACQVSLQGVVLCSHTSLTVLQASRGSTTSGGTSPRRPGVIDPDAAAVGHPHHRFVGVCSVPLLQFYRHGQRVSITRGAAYLFDNAALTSDIQSKGGSAFDSNPGNWENLAMQCESMSETDQLVEALIQGHAEEIYDPPLMPDNLTELLRSSSRPHPSPEECSPISRDPQATEPESTNEEQSYLRRAIPPATTSTPRHRRDRSASTTKSAPGRRDAGRSRSQRQRPKELEHLWRQFMKFEHHRQHLVLYMHKELVHQAYNAAEASVLAHTSAQVARQSLASYSTREKSTLKEIEQKLLETEELYEEVRRQKKELDREREAFRMEKRPQTTKAPTSSPSKLPSRSSRTQSPRSEEALGSKHRPRSQKTGRTSRSPATKHGYPLPGTESFLGHVPNHRNQKECRLERVVPGADWRKCFFPYCEEEVRHGALMDVAIASKQPRGLITLETVEPASLLASRSGRRRRSHSRSRHQSAAAGDDGLRVVAVVRFNAEATDRDTMERRLNRCDFPVLQNMHRHREAFRALQEEKCGPIHQKTGQGHPADSLPGSRSTSEGEGSSAPGGVSNSPSEVNYPHGVAGLHDRRSDDGAAAPLTSSARRDRERVPSFSRQPTRPLSPYLGRSGLLESPSQSVSPYPRRGYPPASAAAHPSSTSGRGGRGTAPYQPPRMGHSATTVAMAVADERVDRAILEVAEARQRRLIRTVQRQRGALLALQEVERAARRRLQLEEEPLERLAIQCGTQPLKHLGVALQATGRAEQSHREALTQMEQRARAALQRQGQQFLRKGVDKAKEALRTTEAAERVRLESEALSAALDLIVYAQRQRAMDAAARARQHQRRHLPQRNAGVLAQLCEAEREDREAMEVLESRTRLVLRREMREDEESIADAALQKECEAQQQEQQRKRLEREAAAAAEREREEREAEAAAKQRQRERKEREAAEQSRREAEEAAAEQQRGASPDPEEASFSHGAEQTTMPRTGITSRESTGIEGDASYNRRRRLDSQRRVKPFHYMTFSPEDMDFKPNAESAIEGILGCTINRNLEVVEISRPLPKAEAEDLEFQAGDMILDASGQSLHSISHLREVLGHRIMLIQEEGRLEFPDLPEEELLTNPALQKYIEVLCEHHNFLMQVLRGCEIFQIIVKS